MAKLIIKIGTNVLTASNGNLDHARIKHLIKKISFLHKDGNNIILVSSGAVGSGKEINEFKKIKNNLIKRQMLASIGQNRLMQIYNKEFKKYNIIVAQALLVRTDFSNRQIYLNIRNVLENLLKEKVIPVINENDVVATHELNFGDNDKLAVLTASIVSADKLILLTHLDGLFTCDPETNKEAKLIKEIKNITKDLKNICSPRVSNGGLGGMKSKMEACLLASRLGVEVVIANGKKDNIISDIMSGNYIGTTIPAKQENISGQKKWLQAGAKSKGQLILCPGLVNILEKKKKGISILAVGIYKCRGDFKSGDIVDLVTEKGEIIARGKCNYDKKEMQKVLDCKDKTGIKEVVHCDHLVYL